MNCLHVFEGHQWFTNTSFFCCCFTGRETRLILERMSEILKKNIKTNLQRNDRAMIRQICSIKPEDVAKVRSSELLAKVELEDLNLILRE